MPRASYIYIVLDTQLQVYVCGFTVKHEAFSFVNRRPTPDRYAVISIPDGRIPKNWENYVQP